MTYNEEDYLEISGLQHFRFCRRQWALIHIEQLWGDNLRTVEGKLLHERAHDNMLRERRGDVIYVRDLRIYSPTLGISGACDVVEYRRADNGIKLADVDGSYLPYPIEYKRGSPRNDDANELQLCAQAMCLEEMLCCDIPEGALYFGETRHRLNVKLDETLRSEVRKCIDEMHRLYERHYTPKVKPSKACNACSLKEQCLPALMKNKSAVDYVREHLED